MPITLTLDSQVKTVRVNSKLTKYKTVNNNGKMKIALPRPSTFRPNSSKSTNIVFSFFVWYIRVFCAKMRDTWLFFHQSAPLQLCAKALFLATLALANIARKGKFSKYIVCFGGEFVNTFVHIAKIKWQILSRYSTKHIEKKS